MGSRETNIDDCKDYASERGSFVLTTDGSGTGTIEDPAEAAVGGVLRDPYGKVVAEISKSIGRAINTVAEYTALIEGLELAKASQVTRIRAFVDSELLVDQISDEARVKSETLRPLHQRAEALLHEFSNWRLSWIPRRWNSEADALARKALD